MKVKVFVIIIIFSLFLISCSRTGTTTQETNKLGELYVETIDDASNWKNKPKFLAITDKSFSDLDEKTINWILTRLNEKYEEVYIFEAIKNDRDKFKYKVLNGRKTLISVINGMIIQVEIKSYEESKATVEVTAKKSRDVGVIPIYEAIYKNGNWQIKKKVQAEI